MAVPEARARSSKEEEGKEAHRNKKRSSILGSLREAIRKVRFLLSFSATRWMLLTSAGVRGAPPRRGLSFGPRPGLLDLDVEGGVVSPAGSSRTSRSASMGTATTRTLSLGSSEVSPGAPRRTSSSCSGRSPASSAGNDDIDQHAEQFIANFYQQLQMERQVSLQLRYVRGDSLDRTP
ncbi:uncharacterized protein LOC120680217 [Panicum virgatum]|uniref:Uncharacterized protein n=1 Tax=Panicum virgatum TaxID=38727 RepID=A0A8T0R1L8_PANVG|nr:uncharacterized protein LOC120680217 [Panicum virgatum]KAG2579140.1 hypothetical protein PVAP13_6NG238912 [Panicum virgatum]